MITDISTFRLRELINAKYGINNYALGCELIARWVNFEMRNLPKGKVRKWDQLLVALLCASSFSSELYYEEAEALRQIFGLQSINQLYTTP